MSDPAADPSVTVEYSTDKWRMDRVPWASWFCVAGLAIILNADRGRSGAGLAAVYLALVGLAFAGWAAVTLIDRSGYPFYVVLPAFFAIAFLVTIIIAAFGVLGGHSAVGRLWWSQLVNPPLYAFGWMLIYLGCGWIAYALLRHFYPNRAMLELSLVGVAYHRPWLRDVLIPWQQVQGLGHLEIPEAIAVVVVRNDFYEQHIAPKRSFLSPPGSENMFRANGDMMQMALNAPELVVAAKDFRVPLEARWKAFRDRPQSGMSPGPRIVYGRWETDGSWWQVIWFLAPLIGMAVVVLHASSLWPR